MQPPSIVRPGQWLHDGVMGEALSLSLRQEHDDETQRLAIGQKTITGVGVVASRVKGATRNLLRGNICWYLGLHPISAGCKPLVDISGEAKDPSSGSQVLHCLILDTRGAGNWCDRLSVCLCVCPSVCLCVYLSVCLPVCLYPCLSVCLSICVCACVCVSVCLSVCLSVYCVSVCLSTVCLPVCLYPCLHVCRRCCRCGRGYLITIIPVTS